MAQYQRPMTGALPVSESPFDDSEVVPSLRADIQLQLADFGLPGEEKQFYLAILPSGEHLRLTERAYDVVKYLQNAPSDISYTRMAHDLAEQWHTPFDTQVLRRLISSTLAPHGLLAGIPATIPRRRSVLTMRIPLLPRRLVRVLTGGLTWLYHPIFTIPVCIGAIVLFALVASNLLPGASVASPGVIAQAYVYGVLSVLWHELGHATACRRFKVQTGVIGFGLYVIYPAFYTDVTGAWQLPRKQRAIVDLGGIYFQSMALLVLYGLYLLTGEQAYLLAAILNTGMIMFSLNPFLRFDGYWMPNDLLGLVALDRFQRAISLAFISALKRGLRHPIRSFRNRRNLQDPQMANNLQRFIPPDSPFWLKALLGIYIPAATLFWFWFLIALGQWVWRMVPGYPFQVGRFTSLIEQHQWTTALPFVAVLITPWFIMFGLSSAVLRLSRGSYRLIRQQETLEGRSQRIW